MGGDEGLTQLDEAAVTEDKYAVKVCSVCVHIHVMCACACTIILYDHIMLPTVQTRFS